MGAERVDFHIGHARAESRRRFSPKTVCITEFGHGLCNTGTSVSRYISTS